MDMLLPAAVVFATLFIFFFIRRSSVQKERQAERTLADISALGDNLVPSSIHPKIDTDRCLGSGACVRACPEHDVIGIIGGRVNLVNPLACVGHGACAEACPVDAIELVFGTLKRGVELPLLSESFETSVPGVYIVGELGGMGLIRNAIAQGREVGEAIAERSRRSTTADCYDAVVVGAGPSGISATLSLLEKGLRVLLLEGGEFGGTIAHYPRGKVVMTGPIELPGMPKLKRRTMSKEELVSLWMQVREQKKLPLQTEALVSQLDVLDDSIVLHTAKGNYTAANVVLALGRRGSPRKLEVPGEELAKVFYRLLEPEPFEDNDVLVVGGGNSAAECALALAHFGKCKSVALSYRRSEFARLRAQVRDSLVGSIENGTILTHLNTQVSEIGVDSVTLSHEDGRETQLANDAVIVQVGGTPPSALLAKFGISTVEKRGEA